jgi:DNA polymerase III delta prime subunit
MEERQEQQTQEQTQTQQKTEQKAETVNVEEIVKKHLDEQARYLGFESWDDLQAKILEEKGKLYEALEQERKRVKEIEKQYKEQLKQLQKEKEELLIEYKVKSKLADKVIDADKALKLLKAEKKIEVKDGKVFIDNEDVDTAIEKFLNENPFLVKAVGGSGAPHTTEQTEPQSPEERLKQALKKLLGGVK